MMSKVRKAKKVRAACPFCGGEPMAMVDVSRAGRLSMAWQCCSYDSTVRLGEVSHWAEAWLADHPGEYDGYAEIEEDNDE